MSDITTACMDMAGTTVADEGSVLSAFTAAMDGSGLVPGAPGYDEAFRIVHETMGQSKIEVFRRILGSEQQAQRANAAFEDSYAESVRAGLVTPLPGAIETITVLRGAGIRVCLATGFSPATREALLDALGWRPLIDLALSPADAGRGRPWPDLPLTALLRLGGGAVSEFAVVGDTASDVQSGVRAGPAWWRACSAVRAAGRSWSRLARRTSWSPSPAWCRCSASAAVPEAGCPPPAAAAFTSLSSRRG